MRAWLVLFPLAVVAVVVYLAETGDARALASREATWGHTIEAGDIVFQDLDCGERCALIRETTHSRYAHVGVVVMTDGERFVWEALGPVGPVPLDAWVARGVARQVAVYRPNHELRRIRPRVEASMRSYAGRPVISRRAATSCAWSTSSRAERQVGKAMCAIFSGAST